VWAAAALIDNYSGQSYEHRRGWVEELLLFLSSIFSIDICAYAVMSNHVHVVLHVDVKLTQIWSDNDVVERWHRLHKGTLLTQMFAKGDTLSPGQQLTLDDTIAEYRRRLHDISWLMRNLNELSIRRIKAIYYPS
jgi:REP element-mobilizing transposase RayT